MPATFYKIYALIKREILEGMSYRFSFFLAAANILFMTGIFFFIAKITPGETGVLERYHGDYFAFVLIGLAFSSFLNVSLDTFSVAVRNEQVQGTLEALLATPTPLSVIFAARLMWNGIISMFHVMGYFIAGVVFMGASYSGANLAAVPVIALLSLGAFSAVGMFSAGFLIAFKRGNPVNIFIGFASAFFGGVYFPIEIMPGAFQTAAKFIPITWSLRLMRDACMNGASFSAMAKDLGVLFLFCAVLLPLGSAFLSWCLRRARKDGSLTHY